MRDIQNTQCLLNVEHLSASCPHVTLQFADSKGDVGLGLVKEGLVMVEVRKEKQFQKVITEYLNAQESAKSARVSSCLWVLEGLSLRGVALWLPLGHTSLKNHVLSPSLTAEPVALWRLPS